MTIIQTAIKGMSWLALMRAISQIFSWGTTIIVARLLVPGDYGLMEMATIFTGYVVLISELGLGSAIIQRPEVKDEELASIFWFFLFWGMILMVLCYLLATPTAALFNNEAIIRLTKATGVIYIFSVLLIVPRALLLRELRFKAVGCGEASSVLLSCVVMLVAARMGAGVWTLIVGHLVREITKFAIFAYLITWRPKFHYCYREVRPFLSFGVNVALGNSLDYIVCKSDRYFCGRRYDAGTLGLYSLGLQIAQMANEKIISIVNNVTFPVFSKYQDNNEKTKYFLLKLTGAIALVTGPIFFGLAVVGEELILLLLGEKWQGAVLPLKILCVGQYIVALTSPFVSVNIAQGRPRWVLYFNIGAILVLPSAFYYCSQFGFVYTAIPWITFSPLLRFVFMWQTLKVLGLELKTLSRELAAPFALTITMTLGACLTKVYCQSLQLAMLPSLLAQIASGAILVGLCLFAFRARIGSEMKAIWNL